MKYRISILFALLGFLAQAQEQLTLSEAVNYALKNKADAVKAQLDVQNSEYKIQEVRSAALPQISINGDLTYNAIIQQLALVMNGQTQILKMGLPWQSTATVSLNQQIFNQAVFTGLKAAKTTREFYKINAQLTEEQVIEKVATSYYEVYKTKTQVKTLDATIGNTTRIRGVIKSLYDNGLAKKIDLDRTDVNLNNLKSNRQQLMNSLSLQENSLKYLIGMDINTPIELPDNTFDVSKHILIDETANVVDNLTAVKVLEKQNELLLLNKKAVEAEGIPSLSFNANYGYLGMGEDFPWFSKDPNTNWSNFSTFGLKLSIPVFHGGSIRAKVKQAQIDIEKSQTDIRDTRLALDLAYKNAVTQMNNSLITLNMQKENVNLAQEVLSNIENNYKFGLATLTDLLDAETSYTDAQNNYTSASLDYKLAEVQLIKAKGELKTLTETELEN